MRAGCRENAGCQTSCHYLTTEFSLQDEVHAWYLAFHFIRMAVPQEGPPPSWKLAFQGTHSISTDMARLSEFLLDSI
jgi:hypothetical protein